MPLDTGKSALSLIVKANKLLPSEPGKIPLQFLNNIAQIHNAADL